jgi:hypothetical protein
MGAPSRDVPMNSPPRRGTDRRTRATGRRGLAGGVVIAALYLGTVAFAWPLPIRILYDGLVPLPPYRWVHPPPSRARDNRPPLPGAGTISLGPPSQAVEVSTDDDQALVTFPRGIVAPRPGESSVKITIVPLDPVSVAPAPNKSRFDGNAYRIEARYAASGEPAVLTAPASVVLRYPVHATVMLWWSDPAWTPLSVSLFTGSQQALSNTNRLGVFAAATSSSGRAGPVTAGPGCLAGAFAVFGLIGAMLARRVSVRRRAPG